MKFQFCLHNLGEGGAGHVLQQERSRKVRESELDSLVWSGLWGSVDSVCHQFSENIWFDKLTVVLR